MLKSDFISSSSEFILTSGTSKWIPNSFKELSTLQLKCDSAAASESNFALETFNILSEKETCASEFLYVYLRNVTVFIDWEIFIYVLHSTSTTFFLN